MPEAPVRPELIHLDVDRRLGHEWDEWDGQPLPDQGSFDAHPKIFFFWSAAVILVAAIVVAAVLFLLAPRLAVLHALLPRILVWAAVVSAIVVLLWWQIGEGDEIEWWHEVEAGFAGRQPL